jgi:hypothetical protein
MDWHLLLTPWNLCSGLFGLTLGITVLATVLVHRRQIGAALLNAARWLFSPVGFFSLVIIVFMVISVLESGAFFSLNITHGAVFGLLGYALALGFDLVSLVCMIARLNAERLHDEQGQRLNLAGVIVCAAVSAFANAVGSLEGYNPVNLIHTPPWMRVLAPWLSMVFPTMIVILSMTLDHLMDHTPGGGVDVDTYRAREHKRVELL